MRGSTGHKTRTTGSNCEIEEESMTEPRGQDPNQEESPTIQAARTTEAGEPAQQGKAAAPAALELRAAKLTDVGQARPHNEDYVDFSIPSDPRQLAQKGAIFMVADGMGGHQAGEVASKGAVEVTLAHYQADTAHEVGTSLVRAFRAANQQLYAQAEGDASKGGMGTTLVAAVILGRKVYVANVGDSRAYLINNHGISQITEDHSWVEEQVRAGLLSDEQARRHPQRNLVTRALGSKPSVEVDLFEGEISAGDSLLLCSDGLTGRVADQEIAAIVREHPPIEAARRLVALANERGGNDNITVLIINAEEATPTVKAPMPAKPQPARRSRLLPALGVLGGLLLLVAVAVGVLAASGILPLSFLQVPTGTPTPELSVTPEATAVGTTQAVTPTIAATATLSPTGTVEASAGATLIATAATAASPAPLVGSVTLVAPTDGMSLTGVVTFTWDFGPGPLREGLAFQLVIGQGDPSEPGAQEVGSRDREMARIVDLDALLEEPGEYYWTVRVVEIDGSELDVPEADARPFVYRGPEPAPEPEGG
jgi:serine/threonine protein phosphatase PrpC